MASRLQPCFCVRPPPSVYWSLQPVLEPATCLVPTHQPAVTLCLPYVYLNASACLSVPVQVIEHGEVGKESQRTWLYELRLRGAEGGV